MNHATQAPLVIRPDDIRMWELIDVLRAAGTRPLTFGELIDRGVTEPAHGIRVLGMAGYRIERVQVVAGGRRTLGFKLTGEPRAATAESSPLRGSQRLSRGWRRRVEHG